MHILVRIHAYPCTSFAQQSAVQQTFGAPSIDLRPTILNAASSAIFEPVWQKKMPERTLDCSGGTRASPTGYFERSGSTRAVPSSHSECYDSTGARPSSHFERSGGLGCNRADALAALGQARADVSSALAAPGGPKQPF